MRSSRPAGDAPNGNSAEPDGATGATGATGGSAPPAEGEPSGTERSPTQVVVDGWRREWRRQGGGGEAEGAALEECFRQQCLRKEIGGKVMLTLQLLREAVTADEKVLLFSQSLETLEVLENVLQRTPSPRAGRGAENTGGWQEGLDYLRLDGQTSSDERCRMVPTTTS